MVSLSLNVTTHRSIVQRFVDTLFDRTPGSVLEQQPRLRSVIWDFNVKRRLDRAVIRSVLRLVDLALEDARCQLLRRLHEVDRGSVHCILPRLGPAGQETLELPSVHEVDDGVRFTLSCRQDPVPSP